MYIQIVKFETTLTEAQAWEAAETRIEAYRALPGLIQKFYVKLAEPNHFSGVYIWESEAAMKAFRQSELAATIPAAFKVVGAPEITVGEVAFLLRDADQGLLAKAG
jgi:quinol monooxygenase YgiN